MKRILMLGVLLVALSVSGYAQKKPYKVVFYNLENFFDTQNDPDVLDDEFTPDGPKKWTQDKYDLSSTYKCNFLGADNKQ